jgi:DNA-binding NarL/FixJ family response regulator
MLPWALAGLAQAAAQAGEAELARGAVQEMELRPIGHKGFECELGLARAWRAAADGELSRAHAQALAAADLAQSRGQDAFALRALHVLCRLGEAAGAAPRIARLADHVDGPFAQLAAAHAAALVARDGRALLEVADRFGALDARLLAAEAAQAAAAAHRAAGREASARTAAARCARWLEHCEDCRPPTLLAGSVQELTPREREIALLAASGLTSRQIAERLVVSVRTIDNHLQHAYRKLGIARREELPGVLI